MTYKDRLHCWAIARLLPSEQWIIVARFRSRSDADGHFQFLRQTIPHVKFEVVFDRSGDRHRLAAAGEIPDNILTSALWIVIFPLVSVSSSWRSIFF
ncbi:hypothetical protein QUB75_09520 [Microcoleus sp. K1-B6]|uniref:hypothetical protein n=1 Tax=unclassified Microcoleus TaxID=2642155 RepID=UPI002FD40A35